MHTAYWDPEWAQCWMGGYRRAKHGYERARHHSFWQEFMGERGQRADRGVVRYLVLDAVAQQPRHGYEIMQAIAERSGGAYKPSPGVVYPTLQMLEEMGLIRGVESAGRKVFEITAEGRRELEANRLEVEDFYERAAGPAEWEQQAEIFADLAGDMAKLFRLYRLAARRGRLTTATKKAIRNELDAAIERIEAILRGD
jgi:DNA-binding PadR family transcriptional regulator